MKVILIKDVKAQGKKGDVINVSDGYANNFLLKNNLAVPANAQNVSVNNQQKAQQEKVRAQEKKEAQELAKKLENQTVSICVSVGANGKVFGSVTNKEIETELKKIGLEVDRKKIVLDSPIKTVGNFTVLVKLYHDVTAKLKIKVLGQ